MDLETWQPGWALLLSLAHRVLISLPPLSQGVAKKWVTSEGETVGSVGGGSPGAGETKAGLMHKARQAPDDGGWVADSS